MSLPNLVRLGRTSVASFIKVFNSNSARGIDCVLQTQRVCGSIFCQHFKSLQTIEKSKAGFRDPISDEALFDEEFKTVSTLLTTRIKDNSLVEVSEWLNQVLAYNVPHGKKNRGLGVVKTFKYLVPETSLDDRRLSALLGWCVEMCQAFFLVMDDVMDQSVTRRGMPCWFRQNNVGLMAINDAILLENGLFQVLKEFFRHHPSYIDIVDAFHETIQYTASGQCLDMLSTSPNSGLDFKKFTENRHAAIVQYKTAYYTFCLPVRLALLLAGQGSSYTQQVESLLLTVGNFFQVQDDYLDCFGDPLVTGKHGTDIEDGKCSWPIVMALQTVSAQDRRILQENYGLRSPENVQKVMAIYKQVDIPRLYEKYETETYDSICKQIEAVTKICGIPVDVFYGLLNKVYKRRK